MVSDINFTSVNIEDEMKKGSPLEKAVLAVAPKLEGSYAFLVISSHDPGKIVSTRKYSPLAVGVGEDGYFVASDALAFSGLADQLIPLADTEIAVLTAETTTEINAIKTINPTIIFNAPENASICSIKEPTKKSSFPSS